MWLVQIPVETGTNMAFGHSELLLQNYCNPTTAKLLQTGACSDAKLQVSLANTVGHSALLLQNSGAARLANCGFMPRVLNPNSSRERDSRKQPNSE